MTVSKDNQAPFIGLTGTLDEVLEALKNEKVSYNEVCSIFYNGTNITAVYTRG